MSAETGLSAHTLRFYEQENLFLNEVSRDSVGRRVYRRADVLWLHLLTRLRDSGMPLADIARYADLVRAGAGNERQRLDLLREHREKMQAEMARLTASMEAVAQKITLYESALAEGKPEQPWQDDQGDCMVVPPPERSGRQQPPRYTGARQQHG
nr:MerR family transcriptional regulator [Kineosporia babensis]